MALNLDCRMSVELASFYFSLVKSKQLHPIEEKLLFSRRIFNFLYIERKCKSFKPVNRKTLQKVMKHLSMGFSNLLMKLR